MIRHAIIAIITADAAISFSLLALSLAFERHYYSHRRFDIATPAAIFLRLLFDDFLSLTFSFITIADAAA
jgi:hypothetical protein